MSKISYSIWCLNIKTKAYSTRNIISLYQQWLLFCITSVLNHTHKIVLCTSSKNIFNRFIRHLNIATHLLWKMNLTVGIGFTNLYLNLWKIVTANIAFLESLKMNSKLSRKSCSKINLKRWPCTICRTYVLEYALFWSCANLLEIKKQVFWRSKTWNHMKLEQ